MRTTLRLRGAVTAAALVLPLAGTAFVASPAQAANDPKPIASAADWVAGQLTNGLVVGQYGADAGLTIDAATALQTAGGHASDVAAIRSGLNTSSQVTSYAGDGTAESYAGPTAKLLVFSLATGGTATFGGADLQTRLENLIPTTTGANRGRIKDTSQYGDFANTIGQSYAARGLTATGSGKAAAATSFLLDQQCSAGFFRLSFAAATAATQTCDSDTTSVADPDVTSYAVLNLLPQQGTGSVAAALARAKTWLASRQKADGSFGGGTSTPGSNANSTGLAGYALAQLGDTAAAQKAATYVRSLQVHQPSTCTDALSNAQGVIGYDASTLSTGRYNGLGNATVLDKFRRSTTQGLLVLGNAQAGSGALSAPKVFARSKKATTVSVSGVAPGDSVCLTGTGVARLGTAGQDGVAGVSVTAPKSGRAVYTLVDSAGHSTSATLRVLPNKRLKVYVSKKRATRGAHEYVVVSGLAAGEPVRIKLYGTTRTLTANAKGKAAITFKAGQRLRTVKVKAFGRFGGVRHGTNTFKVVR